MTMTANPFSGVPNPKKANTHYPLDKTHYFANASSVAEESRERMKEADVLNPTHSAGWTVDRLETDWTNRISIADDP